MSRAVAVALFIALLAGCRTAPPAPLPSPPPDQANMVDHAGDSTVTAIAVPAEAPGGGVDFENQWIFHRYGRFRRVAGGTGSAEGRRYDVVKIELPGGEKKTIYFDITENWERWSPP